MLDVLPHTAPPATTSTTPHQSSGLPPPASHMIRFRARDVRLRDLPRSKVDFWSVNDGQMVTAPAAWNRVEGVRFRALECVTV
jgi:hypothetical protein